MNAVMDYQRQEVAATPGLFLLNPSGNHKFVSGAVSRIGNGTTMLIIAAIFIIAAIGAAVYFGGEILRADEVQRSGVVTDAEIIDGHSSRGRRGGTSYYVTYEFTVDGQEYTKEQQIGSDVYNDMGIGKTVEVKYLPSDPNVSILAGEASDDTARNNNIIFLAILLPITLGIAALVLWSDRTNRLLSNNGQMLRGQITNIQGRAGSKGAFNVTVDYTFTTPDGRQVTKKQTFNRPDLRKNPMPAPGTPVAVLYVNDKLQRLM